MAHPPEIEPLSNRLLVHRASAALLPRAARLGLHPNAVTTTGLFLGVLAALSYLHWRDPRFAVLGFLLMLGWHICDGLDGALARATGKTSPLGRLLDGVADYTTFVLVYIALVVSQPHPALMLPIAILSGAAHILQSLFYEGIRETYIRRGRGQLAATRRSAAGGPVERLYNLGEAFFGNHATRLDAHLLTLAPTERAAAIARWQHLAAPRIRAITLLSANGRTFAIFLACLAGRPWAFWLWEIVGLTLLAMAGHHWLRQAERRVLG